MKSFQGCSVHYVQKKPTRLYLSEDLNILSLLYVQGEISISKKLMLKIL